MSVNDFHKSPEGIQAFSELGQPYPDNNLEDALYEQYLKDTTADPKVFQEYGQGYQPIEIVSISRKKLSDGREFIIYSQNEHRIDKARNVKSWFSGRHGIYPKPKALYRLERGDFVDSRVFDRIDAIDTEYSIPFTPENLDKIRDLGLRKDNKTTYAVIEPNGIKHTVWSYDDLRNGNVAELIHFNRVPRPIEKAEWLEKQGIEADKQLSNEILYSRMTGQPLPPSKEKQIPTVAEVKDMIKEDKKESKPKKSKSKRQDQDLTQE